MFKANVGSWDRWIRIVGGALIVSLAFWGPKSVWAWLGLVPLATGVVRYCPAYDICGLSTAKKGS